MKRFRAASSNALLRLFTILFMSISLVGVLLSAISYVYTLQSYKDSISDYNTASIQYIKEMIEDRLDSVEQAGQDIFLAISLNEYDEISDTQDAYNLYLFSKLIEVVSDNVNRNELIDSAYIYFSQSDTIVSNYGLATTQEFYQNYLSQQEASYEAWIASLLGHEVDFYQKIESDDALASDCEYIKPFNMYSNDTYGCIVITLDDAEISSTLNTSELLQQSNISICYLPTETTIYQTSNTALNAYVASLDLKIGNTELKDTEYGNLIVIQSVSLNRNWSFISAVPYDTFFVSTQKVLFSIIALLSLQLLLASVLTIVFSRESYKPIKLFVERTKQTLHQSDYVFTGDDLGDLHHITSEMMLSLESVQEQLTDVKPIIENNFLFRLIQGSSLEREFVRKDLFGENDIFEHDGFMIVKIMLEDNNNFIKNNSMKEWELAKLAVMNISQELFAEKVNVMSINYDVRNVAFVLNFAYTTDAVLIEKINTQIDEVLSEIQSVLESVFAIYTSVGVSKLLCGLEQLYDCHKQACYALNQKIASSQYGITHYTDLKMKAHAYSYTLQDELYLINSVKTGEITQVKEVLQGIIADNESVFSGNDATLSQCFLLDLMSTMLRIIEDLNVPADVMKLNIPELLFDTANKRSVEKITQYYEQLCLWVHKNKKSHNTEKKEEILKYIHENYCENSLSLVDVADQVDLNPTYLSVFIKEQFGETFINYVLNLRMNEAQRLLRETKLSQQEIATQIGYANSGVFIRVFKKKFGQTPGMYRQQVKPADDFSVQE